MALCRTRIREAKLSVDWVEKLLKLKFQLGEITLFSLTFPALVLDKHFTEIPDDPMVPLPPFERYSGALEVIAMYSHPVKYNMLQLSILPHAIRYIPSQYNRYWVELTGEFDTYLQKFSSKSRNTLTRKLKKFSKFSEGDIVWREFTNPGEFSEFHFLALKVSAKSYQEKLLDCGLPAGDKFLNEMEKLAEQELARGYILYHFEKPVAYIFCPIQNNIVFYEYVGHDPDYQKWSPGTMLQYFALKNLFGAEKLRLFDFTEGAGSHKEFFSTNKRFCADIYYFRRTFRNLLLIFLHLGVGSISTNIVKVLEKLGLKKMIKKLFRSAS
jgi:hypothetical protein